MFSLKPDLERSLERLEAFSRYAVLDRPVVNCMLYKPQVEWLPYPVSGHATPAERWMDVAYQAEYALADLIYQKLCAAGQPISAWVPLTCAGKFYIPSNDFSGMISPAMVQEFFLPGLRRECQALDRSIYHLIGPSALRHLEAVPGIPELDAVQFVPTATDKTFAKWAHVYRRIQAGGKSLQVTCRIEEIEQVMQALRPQGVYLEVRAVPSAEAAEAMLKMLEEWR